MSIEINKLALVTGASRGIGKAIALGLGQQGATVIGTATSEQGAEAISAMLQENNIEGKGYVLNIADKNSIDSALKSIQGDYAAPEILVNNAGITRDNIMLRMKDEEWDDVINTNLSGIYYTTKACLKAMVKARWGRIITISSVVGAIGNPGQANYAAAKAGVVGFTKSVALELASRNVTANVVAPGFIKSDMTDKLDEKQQAALLQQIPMGCIGAGEDIANGVVFLASDMAKYVTGQTLHVNGGMFMP